jgi:hypothetical protein
VGRGARAVKAHPTYIHTYLKGRKLDHRQVYASYVFNVWLRLVLCCEYLCANNVV